MASHRDFRHTDYQYILAKYLITRREGRIPKINVFPPTYSKIDDIIERSSFISLSLVFLKGIME